LIDGLWTACTDGSSKSVDELLITADVHTRDKPSVDEVISRVEGTKVYGMDDVLSHHTERQRQAGMTGSTTVDYFT